MDLDEIELGERAARWLHQEELGMLYKGAEDRAWAVIVGCCRKVARYAPEEADRWYPQLDRDGMWKGRHGNMY